MNKFYVTTPIYYVNDEPHIGHTTATLAVDVIARYHRLIRDEVFFLTGTDEHGLKIAQAAAKQNLEPQVLCDQVSEKFRKTWGDLNISYDYFIRTTNPGHKKIVQEFIQKIYEKGEIYKSTYKGLYCIGCENFLAETDLTDGHCPLHRPEQTIEQEEENWFFRLSKYVPQIIKLIENDKTNYVFPEAKRHEVLSKLKQGVHDISISRANLDWGIPIPWDQSQTIYVWVDALINYYSAIQFLPDKEKFWPADLHLLGKEILWFHTVIWQAMLLAADLPLPKKTFVHSFYNIKGQKMSKSLGNVISPKDLITKFGIDGARYLIISSFPSENDASVSRSSFVEKYNANLANGLGNLVSRLAKLCEINNFVFSENYLPAQAGQAEFIDGVADLINDLKLSQALEKIWTNPKNGISALDKFINDKKIWELKGDEAKTVLSKAVKMILNISCNLKPFLPKTAEKVEAIFTQSLKLDTPLFPRLK